METRGVTIARNFDTSAIDELYISDFNQGNSIYRSGEPFASFVTIRKDQTHSLYYKGQELKKWPKVVGVPGVLLVDNKTNKTEEVVRTYGLGASTRIGIDTIERWILFWGMIDLIESVGSVVINPDNRIPYRDQFLKPYKLSAWTDDFINSFSAEETQQQIRLSLANHFSPSKYLTDSLGRWISDYPDSLYSLKYDGSLLFVFRHSTVQTAGFYANRENHPFADVLKAKGLN